MVKLTDEIKADMQKIRIFPFATSSPLGEPNVAPINMLILQEDNETIWVIDNFMQKTLDNVIKNPRASFYIWSPETVGAWQIKGTITVVSGGPDHEKAKDIAKARKEGSPAKTLLKMNITDVYSVKPGPTAGKKLM
ncbi:MAG: pyridoxamine 5'-phosphate oxidase family protein [Methanomassiliicoccaceae archaeon]|jgi:predicted pyridoxine 5'-phosphate oxidase superfamily flavin-nucleotide-binding protein|nr:pyridoxamine 5'-phosphate oxidase family protein [Methanomassiliicoccaceae archaeon]